MRACYDSELGFRNLKIVMVTIAEPCRKYGEWATYSVTLYYYLEFCLVSPQVAFGMIA